MTEISRPTVEWRDTTSYSKGDSERVPTTYSIVSGDLYITITCGHIYHRPDWVMHCHALHMDTVPLKAKSVDAAKDESLNRVRKKLTELSNAYFEICGVNP